MELRHLRYFVAVAEHGNFNRASRKLHLSQPALSRQVRDLEEEIGIPLFHRNTNSITLSKAGESFYDEARDILAAPTGPSSASGARSRLTFCESATRRR